VPKQEYSREDVRRMLGVSEQQLRGWERQGLVRDPEVFSFKDLIALRTLLKLRENRISTQKIGLAVASLKQKIAGLEYPLSEVKFLPEGRKLDGKYMPWQAVGTLGDDELRGLLMALKEKKGA